MSYIRELRVEARMTVTDLAEKSKVSWTTIKRMDAGEPVGDIKAAQVCEVLTQALGREVKWSDERIPIIS